ncbi:hypothetical protein [Arenimonas sp.]|uniref:hypothetical protein n=1 Tax=Arenimonas sp. TaxID=1872635 RepID=UPI0035B1C9E0
MRKPSLAALLLIIVALLAACAGGPPKRVFPPQASVQELRVLEDGSWRLSLRIRNFSTVPMRFSRLQASLTVGGQDATRFDFDPGVTVGPGSAELVEQVFTPGAGARDAVQQALGNRRSVAYVLAGRLASSDPGTDDAIEYPSRLDPVPGLDGVLR